MIYYSTRILILIYIWVSVFLKYKTKFKNAIRSTRSKLMALVYFTTISYTVFSIMLFLPFESIFIRFKTPEQAFAYSNILYRIDKVILGNDSAFIVYSSFGRQQIDYLNKNDDQWLMVERSLYRNNKFIEAGDYLIMFIENPSTKQVLVFVIQDFPDETLQLDHAVISDNQNGSFYRYQVVYEKYDLKSFYYYQVINSSALINYEIIIDGISYTYSK